MLRVAVSSPRFIEAFLSNKTPHSIQRTDKVFLVNKTFYILKRNEIKKLTRQALLAKVHLRLIQSTLEYFHSCMRPQQVKICISLRNQKWFIVH